MHYADYTPYIIIGQFVVIGLMIISQFILWFFMARIIKYIFGKENKK